nr:C39 family peptidase [uncultured Desulfobacter sp.]
MKIRKIVGIVCLWGLLLSVVTPAGASTVLLENVPAYEWYHGCGPTAAASILGYWDLNGYDSLFDVSGWEEIKLTENVQDEISSPAHNLKYDSTPDNSTLPDPDDTSIADFFHTSEDFLDLAYGSSRLSYSGQAFTGYAAYRGYDDWYASYVSFNSSAFTWEDLVEEINNGRPMMFLVDSDGENGVDHFIPVFGYNEEDLTFAFYDVWDEEETAISWASFLGVEDGTDWGIGWAVSIVPGTADAAVPLSTSGLYMMFGLVFVLAQLRKINLKPNRLKI